MNDNFDIAYLPLMIALGLFNPGREKLINILTNNSLKKKNKLLSENLPDINT
jgi:hypothetical protein